MQTSTANLRASKRVTLAAALVGALAVLALLATALLAVGPAYGQEGNRPVAVIYAPSGTDDLRTGQRVELNGDLSFLDGDEDAELSYNWEVIGGTRLQNQQGADGPVFLFDAPTAAYLDTSEGRPILEIRLTVTSADGREGSTEIRLRYAATASAGAVVIRCDGCAGDNTDAKDFMDTATPAFTDASGPCRADQTDTRFQVDEGATIFLRVDAPDIEGARSNRAPANVTSYRWRQGHGPLALLGDSNTASGRETRYEIPVLPDTGSSGDKTPVCNVLELHLNGNQDEPDQTIALWVVDADQPTRVRVRADRNVALPTSPGEVVKVRLDASGTTDADDITITVDPDAEAGTPGEDRNIGYVWQVEEIETGDRETITTGDPDDQMTGDVVGTDEAGDDITDEGTLDELFTAVADAANFESDATAVMGVTGDKGPVVDFRLPPACDHDGADASACADDVDEHPLLGGSIKIKVTAMKGNTELHSASITLLVEEAPNQGPTAVARTINNVGRLVTELSVFEGEEFVLTGIQSDDPNEREGDFLTYTWTQTRPRPEDASGRQLASDATPAQRAAFECVNCAFGSDSAGTRTTTSPEVALAVEGELTGLEATRSGRRARDIRFLFELEVEDQYGVTDTDGPVRITVTEANEPPTVDVGDDITVIDNEQADREVGLAGSVSDPDPGDTHTFAWTQDEGDEVELADSTAAETTFVLPDEGGVFTFTLTATDARGLSDSDSVTVTAVPVRAAEEEDGEEEETTAEGNEIDEELYYSGVITGPDFCTNRSLGGPRTYPFDSDGDGVAETCSLPTTREAAIEQQNAWQALAAANADRFAELVAEECEQVPDWVASDPSDACETGEIGEPLETLPLEGNEMLYSGGIPGPHFCINLSLGGPTTYPFDSDGNGVAETCSLPWSRREAVARQNALERLETELAETS